MSSNRNGQSSSELREQKQNKTEHGATPTVRPTMQLAFANNINSHRMPGNFLGVFRVTRKQWQFLQIIYIRSGTIISLKTLKNTGIKRLMPHNTNSTSHHNRSQEYTLILIPENSLTSYPTCKKLPKNFQFSP